MRLELRETGSIRVAAGKDEVIDILRRTTRDSAVTGDRVEAPNSTYVVRASEQGTQVFHMRRDRAPVALVAREREALRTAVRADLFELQRVLDAAREK